MLSGTIYLPGGGFISPSAGNSTDSTLTSGASWVGSVEQNAYKGILVRVESDVVGTLYIGFSVDGINWNEEPLLINSVKHEYTFTRVKAGEYFRVRYINGSTGQGFFRLFSYYGEYGSEVPLERNAYGAEAVPSIKQSNVQPVLDLPFVRELGTSTLAADVVANTSPPVIPLSPGHGVSVGNTIELADATSGSIFMQAIVLGVAGDNITLDTPVNYSYTAANTIVVISERNLASTPGSLAAPVVYRVKPLPNQAGDITRIITSITDNSAMDFGTFGGMTALTNGMVIRKNNGDGTYRHITNWKTNSDMERYSGTDAKYQTRTAPSSVRGISARSTWEGEDKHNATQRLIGALNESLEILVQDDLGPLDNYEVLGQGSELQL